METNPHRWIAALRSSHDRLVSIVQPLSPDETRAQSYDTDWSIAQVLGHLESQAEIFSVWVQAAVDRTDPTPREFLQGVWDAWNGRGPDQQVADSIVFNERPGYGRLDPERTPALEITAPGVSLPDLRCIFPGV